MTDGSDSDDGQFEGLHERIESLEEAGETLEETADTVQERTADTLGEGSIDSLFDGVDDATDETDADMMTDVPASPASLFPSRERLLVILLGALPLFFGLMLLGISVVPGRVSLLLASVTALQITFAALSRFREHLLGDLLGGALLGLVVGSVAFLFASLVEFAVGAI